MMIKENIIKSTIHTIIHVPVFSKLFCCKAPNLKSLIPNL